MKYHLSKPNLDKKEIKSISKVLRKPWLINGPAVKKFELNFKKKFNLSFCTTVSSCTAGLQLVLQSLKLKKNDEVILSSFNFISAGLAILQQGLKPVFVDLEKNKFDISIKSLKKKINKRTKVIILTHFNGYLQPIEKVKKVSKKFKNIKIIEDCAHVLGSKDNKKKFVGNFSYASVFSFGPTKMITAAGMGGMISSKDRSLIENINKLKSYGMDKSSFDRKNKDKSWVYRINQLGNNFRMTELQAAVGIEQLKKIDIFIKKRLFLTNIYKKKLANIDQISFQNSDFTHRPAIIYFVIIIESQKKRNSLSQFLRKKNIFTSVHWDPPLSEHLLFKKYFKKNSTINSNKLSSKIISLPLHTKMSEKDVVKISESIRDYFNAKN